MIRLGEGKEFLEIEEQERLLDPSPRPGDVRVSVIVRLQDFSGSYSEIWLEKPDLERFVKQLQAIVETRTGKARLEAMSPDELMLELRSNDSLGHFEIAIQLSRYQYSSGDTYWPTVVSGGFEVEPSQLASFLSGFRSLLN